MNLCTYLTLHDRRLMWQLAVDHFCHARQHNMADRDHITSGTPRENYLGLIGELAFAKITGLDWLTMIGRNCHADFEWFIDVKTIRHPQHHIIISDHNVVDHWAYALVGAWRHPWYQLVGWAWGAEIAPAIRDRRDCYWINGSRLWRHPLDLCIIAHRKRGRRHRPDDRPGTPLLPAYADVMARRRHDVFSRSMPSETSM